MLYAVVKESTVSELKDMTEEEYQELAKTCQAIVSVDGVFPQPEVGWLLSGNQLLPPGEPLHNDELDSFQQRQQRIFGEHVANLATDLFGARNLKLGREGNPVNVAALASALMNAKLLLQAGALKTARYVCIVSRPSFPLHTDIFDIIVAEINNFLAINGW